MAKILVVDGELDAHVRERLGSPGTAGAHQFLFVGDAGEAARRAASDAEFPVALVAVGGGAGMEGFRRLREAAPGLALIALAPGGDLAAIRRAMNEGAVDFLTRPIDFEDLSSTVTRVLADVEERRRAREGARRNWRPSARNWASPRPSNRASCPAASRDATTSISSP